MGTFVTLAEVLEARGSALEEDEVWGILLLASQALLDISSKGPGSMCSVLSPGSVLLSASGSLAFKSCGRSEDVISFTAPEAQQGHAASPKTPVEKMVVYSLGMTLYWCVDYHLPQNQPVQLSAALDSLLLSMCEDEAPRRTDLLTVLETSQRHHTASLLPPVDTLLKQLVDDVLRDSVDHVPVSENGPQLTDRSQMVRERLHGGSSSNSTPWTLRNRFRTFSAATYPPEPLGIPPGSSSGRHRDSYSSWRMLTRSPCSPYLDDNRHGNRRSIARFDSTTSLNDKKLKDMGPEFIRVQEETTVVLELPGSIVSKKGKSASTQREVSVAMPNGQSVLIRCEVKSRAGDVFDMLVAHSNLVEHFYFGLAYLDDNEFFFLDNDTKLSKVAPDSWKKVPTTTLVLFLRIKFFVNDISLLLHKFTRHQYYLQLRKDLLEDRMSCHEDTALYLGGLALQAEYGDSMPEVYGLNYFRPDQYVSRSVMEKRALPYIREELLRLHGNNAQMLADESELEFLKVSQQLPEYGVLFYRVVREKKPVEGQIVLGVCAKGVAVYEVKDGGRSTSQTFYWRETASISSNRRKFVIESRGSKKKLTFVTERSRVAKYLCNLCSAQHKFNNEMNSRQLSHSLVSDDSIVQYATACQRAQSSQNKSSFPPSCSETPQRDHDDDSGLTTPLQNDDSMAKLCDDVAARIEARFKYHRLSMQGASTCSSSHPSSTGMRSPACSQRSGSEGPAVTARDTPTKQLHQIPTQLNSEREVICLSLKKDPKLGLGIVIVGEDTVSRYDLGIFVASVVPGGPADKDGRIRKGGRLISLNHTSLEGMTFTEAAEVMQNSPDEVQLIISQAKDLSVDYSAPPTTTTTTAEHSREAAFSHADPPPKAGGSRYNASAGWMGAVTGHYQNGDREPGYTGVAASSDNVLSDCESPPAAAAEDPDGRSREDSLDEIVSVMMRAPKTGSRLSVPTDVRVLSIPQDGCSLASSSLSVDRPEQEVMVGLRKKAGSLGFSIAGGAPNSGIYVNRLVPGGAAERDGRIHSGDRIMEVDGIRFQGFTYLQAVQCLTKTGETVTLVLERGGLSVPRVLLQSPDTGSSLSPHSISPDVCCPIRNNSCPAIMTTPYTVSSRPRDYCFVTDDNTLEVSLRKNSSGLGFTFVMCELEPGGGGGGCGGGSPTSTRSTTSTSQAASLVRVKQLFPGQPAHQSRRIQEGDVILAVNGQPLKALPYPRVQQLFRTSPDEVRLALCRPAPGVLPPIQQLTGT